MSSTFPVTITALVVALCACHHNDEPDGERVSRAYYVTDVQQILPLGTPVQVGTRIISMLDPKHVEMVRQGNKSFVFDYNNALVKVLDGSDNSVKPQTSFDMTMRVHDSLSGENCTYYFFLSDRGAITSAYGIKDGVDYSAPGEDEPERWTFSYNDDGQLTEIKNDCGKRQHYRLIYDQGDIREVRKSENGTPTGSISISYLDLKDFPIAENKSGLCLYDEACSIDIGNLQAAFYAGLLGKGPHRLSASAIVSNAAGETLKYNYSWGINPEGRPVEFIRSWKEGERTRTAKTLIEW